MRRWGKRLLAAGLLLLLLFWGNYSLQTQVVRVGLADLPPEFNGLRIALLADLHGRQFGRENEVLLRAVRNAAPDLIFLCGDLFDENTDLSMLPPLLRALAAIAPTYYVTGNHEWQVPSLHTVLSEMQTCGVRVLRNEYAVLTRGSAQLVIAGIDDPCGPYDQKTPEALVSEIRADCGEDCCILLLAHRNDFLAQWAALGVSLAFCGHCHGGMVRLPLIGGLFGPGSELFPAYDAGLYRQAGSAMFVSRGLGYSRVRVRVLNRPHLPVLTLYNEES